MRNEGAAHKNMEAPRSFEDMVFTKDEKPVNLLNLQNPSAPISSPPQYDTQTPW